ncbi:superinfection exclusion B family protein [Shewanella pneumatophori]|uniref:Superinfection exclusion B family protein n=1 Tax=Shewanella pneumatophori TaxID=314092 RepID=A0A9X1ZI62_9GAMM|nr:superinfection exclusion B family protein [Shewanella pneumatophori]MCL1139945.1 superinfection exclusion B family protein [Shewanella pneumatophori]
MQNVAFKFTSLKMMSAKKFFFTTMLWLALSCAALLFAPKALLTSLSLNEFSQQYAHFIGLGLIIGAAYLLTQILSYFLDEAISYLSDKRSVEIIEEKVKLLDPTERALLREFFLQGETILTLPEQELAVKSLLKAGILECIGNQKHYAIQASTADFKISMRARVHLNRQVLRFPVGEPSAEEMKNLIKARPHFVHSFAAPRKQAA